MKRLMYILLLLAILLVFPQVTYAAPSAGNSMAQNTDILTEVLGTVAVYAAIIAALAAGTEVITDLLRPFFGLERQPQAMETFEQMKEWLPATLKEMSADPQAQAELQRHLNELDSAVERFKGYTSGEKIAETVQKWALGLIKSGNAQLKLKDKLKELETTLEKELKLTPNEIKNVKGEVEKRAKVILGALESAKAMLQKLKDQLTKPGLTTANVDSTVGKALELMNTLVEDEQLKKELKTLLEPLLKPLNLTPAEIDEEVEKASELLKSLKGAPVLQGMINLASSLDSFDRLLDAVERQRGESTSFLRRLWRALRDWKGFRIPSRLPDKRPWKEIRKRWVLGALLYCLEQGWNQLRDWLFSSAEGTASLSTLLTPENAAKAIQALDRQHYLTEARRQRLLRFTTVFVGVALAITLRIDSMQLFQPIMGDNLPDVLYEVCTDENGVIVSTSFLTLEQIQNKLFVEKGKLVSCPEQGEEQVDEQQNEKGIVRWKPWDIESWKGPGRWLLFWVAAATPGMLLSGLAASAGSSFWHDQLDRLRAAKKVTEQVKTVVGQMQSSQDQTP